MYIYDEVRRRLERRRESKDKSVDNITATCGWVNHLRRADLVTPSVHDGIVRSVHRLLAKNRPFAKNGYISQGVEERLMLKRTTDDKDSQNCDI